MDPEQFLSSLRTFIPEAEEFLLKTLTSEVLSESAKSELNTIQDKLNDLNDVASEPSNDSNDSTILTPPSAFLDGSDDELIPSVRSLSGDSTNSGDSNFSLRMTDSDSNEHSQTLTHPVVDKSAGTVAYSSQSRYPVLTRDHETRRNGDRGYSKNGILSGHVLVNSETENSSLDASSPSVEKSGPKEVEKRDSQKRRRVDIPSKKKIKRSKLSELSKNRISNTVCVCIISSGDESRGNDSSPDSPQGLDIVNEERTSQILYPQICHDIPSDDTTSCESQCNDDASYNDDSHTNLASENEENSPDNRYESGDQSPTNFATTEGVNMPPEFSGSDEEPTCNTVPLENGTSQVNDNSETSCVNSGTSRDNSETSRDNSETSCVNSVESGNDYTIEIPSDEDLFITTPPTLFLDSPTDLRNGSKQKSKITDFFNPKVSSTETASLSTSRNIYIFSSGSSSDSDSPPLPNSDPDSSPTRIEPISNDTQNDDVIDIHANPDEAFPSSLSDCETPSEPRTEIRTNTNLQSTDPEDCVTSKPSVFSRLGVKDNSTGDSSTLERQQLIRTLKQHYHIVHQEKRAEYKCDKCRETIQINPGKLFKCKQCLAKFVKIEEFAQHRTIGSEKAFCSHCKVDFRNKCELTQHKKTKKHPNPKLCDNCLQKVESKPNISQICEDNSSPEHEIDGSYRCLKCSKRFTFKSQLESHSTHHHTDANSSHIISENPNSHLPARPEEVWPPPTLSRTNELDSDSEITQNINDADQAFNMIRNRSNLNA